MFCEGVKTVNTSQKASVGIMKNGKTPFPEMHVIFLTIQRKQNSGEYQEMTLTVTLISKGDANLSE